MHKYLRAVGFSQFETKSQVEDFLKENLNETNLVSTYLTNDMRLCGQYNVSTCQGAGISIIKEQEKNKIAYIDFYYPFLKGYDYTTVQECTIEKHSDRETYAGIIDDYRMGIALIFYLSNSNVYNSLLKTHKINDIKIDKIFLSALSVSGRIILPIDKTKLVTNQNASIPDVKFDILNENNDNIGDENDDEIDVEDVDITDDEERDDDDLPSFPSRLIDDELGTKAITIGIGIKLPKNPIGDQESRLKNEDLYSIVETSLVPYGIECDKYQIIAEILSVNRKINKYTNEVLIEMRVSTMGLQFNLMINEADLEGEPLPGRRFRGVIWLLGEVEFLTKVLNKNMIDK